MRSFFINVASVNDAPVGNPQSVMTPQNTSLPILLTGYDVDSSALSFTIAAIPAHGTLSGIAPNVVYTPATNYHGTDSFTFTVSDGRLVSTPATVAIAVVSSNQSPVAVADVSSPTMLQSNAAGFVLLAVNTSNATVIFDGSRSYDSDNDALSYYWWVKDASNSFASGIRVTNLAGLGEWDIALGAYDGQAVSTNFVHLQVITPAQAVRELKAAVNLASIAQAERTRLTNRLSIAEQYFGNGQLHQALDQLRLYIAEAREVFASSPSVIVELGQPAEDILRAVVGAEIATALEKLDTLRSQIDAASMSRYNKKLLLGYLQEASNQSRKAHWDEACKYMSHFESGAEAARLAVEFLDAADEIVDMLNEIACWDDENSWQWDSRWETD